MHARYKDDLVVVKGAREAGWLFGEPVLQWAGSGLAGWSKTSTLSQNQKGSGYTVDLYGGAQSGDDWAACYIPVNELPLTQLDSLYWSWYQTAAETMGLGCVIWIHDPTNFDNRAELTQLGNISGLDKSAGWNSHELVTTTDQFFYYGENTTGADLTAGPPNYYGLDDFQADDTLGTWSIYRISFDWGWDASGTYESAYLAEVKINGLYIPLQPRHGERLGFETKTLFAATPNPSTTKATHITPITGHRVRIHSIFMNTASSTAAQFEVYFGTGANITSTPANAIAACTLDTDTQAFETVQFGDDGPIGAVDSVVSTRTSADITTNGNFTIVYHEE